MKLVACGDCGHMVPVMNLEIHRARVCRGRARPATNNNDTRVLSTSPETGTMECTPEAPETSDTGAAHMAPIIMQDTVMEDAATAPTFEHRSPQHRHDVGTSLASRLQHERSEGSNVNFWRNEKASLVDKDENDDNNHHKTNVGAKSHPQEVISLLDDDDDDDDTPLLSHHPQHIQQNQQQQQQQQSSAMNSEENNNSDQWACPRCTLFNDKSISTCDACQYQNIEIRDNNRSNNDEEWIRNADPVRRERLIDDDDSFGHLGSTGSSSSSSSSSMGGAGDSTASYVGGGAILGGMLGGAAAYMRGRPVNSGVLEGAISGAVSGAFMREVLRPQSEQTPEQPDHQQQRSFWRRNEEQGQREQDNRMDSARTATAMGQVPYPVMSNVNGPLPNNENAPRPRPSFRVSQRQVGPGGVTSTTIMTRSRGRTNMITTTGSETSSGTSRRGVDLENDPLFGLMFQSLLASHEIESISHTFGGVDGMNYEQLLQTFGDGTDNLAAEESIIASLPTAVIKNLTKELPKDARTCAICLEDFQESEVRKTLPCLHGFHEDCVNKWLRTNGACPMCKHRLNE